MLAIGGWLGISYNDARIDRLAAVIFGAGGGLIGDEAGLLLTFENYRTGLTYTMVTGFLALALILILVARYSKAIVAEFAGFTRSRASLYFGVFLATISIAFLMDTDNPIIIAASSISAAVACLIIMTRLIQRIARKRRNMGQENC
jgi:formate-dependent nitrite reductase membrane component NrfD